MSPLVAVCIAFAAGRIALGLAPIVAAGPSARLLGFPAEHDNPTTRLMARLFGVRDIGLGLLVLGTLHEPAVLWRAFVLNLLMDAGDAVMISIPLVKKQGIGRGASRSLFFALAGGSGWVALLCWARH